MKFFFNGGGYHQLIHSLRKRGHVVAQGRAPWIRFAKNIKNWDEYNKHILLDAVKKEKPDVYICSKGYRNGMGIYPDTNNNIRKHVGIMVYWSQDDPFFIPTFIKNQMYVGHHIALSCSSVGFDKYRGLGITPYLFWPAFDSMIRNIKGIKEKNKKDIIFVGTPYACTDIPRANILLWAVQHNLRIEIYGSKAWVSNKTIVRNGKPFIKGHPKLKPYYRGEHRNWRTLHLLFEKSRINISNHVNRAKMYMNDRVPLVMGVGACLIVDKNPGMDQIFKDRQEVLFYKDWNTLKSSIMYYLKNPRLRKQIGINARKKILKFHTYENRANQLLNILKKHGMS